MLERSFQRLGRSREWRVSGSFRNSTIYHDPRHVKGYKVTEISAVSFFFCFKPPRRIVIFCDFYVRCWPILSIGRINAICRDFPRVHLREDLWRAIYDESSTNDFCWIALTNLEEGFEERYNWLKKYWEGIRGKVGLLCFGWDKFIFGDIVLKRVYVQKWLLGLAYLYIVCIFITVI